MSLSFLSKKTWNPTNLKNVEKVWIAEQKADAEEKKLAELQKQIAEERQLQELKELQVQAGLVDKSALQRLDWMYEGPMATMQDHKEETESFLLGKEFEAKAAESEIKKVEDKPGMLFLNSISQKNDMFSRLHEDPLLVMKQNELKKREDVVKNPIKMARIKSQLEAQIKAEREAKRAKKEAKKAKKEAKKAKKKDSKEDTGRDRRRSASPVRGSRGNESPSAKRRRVGSPSPDRRDRGRDAHRGDRDRSRNGDDRTRPRLGNRSRSRSPRRRRSPTPPRRKHGSRSRSPIEPRARKRHDSESPSRDKPRRHVSSEHAHGNGHHAEDRGRRDGDEKTYGLQNGTRRSGPGMSLGPDAKLVAAKERERDEQERQKAQARRKSTLTEEEKRRRLEEMQLDGVRNEEKRKERVERGIKHKKAQEEADKALSAEAKPARDQDHNPQFLEKLNAQVYMGGKETLEERMQRSRHTRQGKADESFLT